MLHFLPSFIVATIATCCLIINTLFWAPLLFLITLLRLLIPAKPWQAACTKVAIAIAEAWISCNKAWMKLCHQQQWQVQGLEKLDKNHWYFVTANHQSWADIFIVQYLLNRKIPMLKFFLKQELIWVPVIGLCWWALDFPFMKRFSKEYLLKHPEKKGLDFKSTQKACEKFQYTPVCVFNFLEGTRFTQAKKQQQGSPFNYLLKPKAGGMAFVLGAMEQKLNTLVNITIAYENHQAPGFWQFMAKGANHVKVSINTCEIPTEFLGKNYQEDPEFRQAFQSWLNQLWQVKDQQLQTFYDTP